MNNLPDTRNSSNTIATPANPVGRVNKELEPSAIGNSEPAVRDAAKEIDLPKELTSFGVHTTSTVVPIPPPVQQMGVMPTGQNIPNAGISISLPLSDDQIAQGMRTSVLDSFRWLAEWCKRQLKRIGMVKA